MPDHVQWRSGMRAQHRKLGPVRFRRWVGQAAEVADALGALHAVPAEELLTLAEAFELVPEEAGVWVQRRRKR